MDTVDCTIVREYHDIWINQNQRLKQSTKWDGLAFEIGLGPTRLRRMPETCISAWSILLPWFFGLDFNGTKVKPWLAAVATGWVVEADGSCSIACVPTGW